ncbi:GNAT family N-acetyltransferase [Streptomyces sp. A7024]|uniref:GNAT family N-acetyltransferase n=1 Tax=Streptomyces coryli TaxID=1128680 RepID=A0A6G4UBD8_9ACTN|nr:GNAT family N-acetyltransferase [Streptomyces coryli]NGN69539.1 GNAT family N-acetyltransferase [Streptomyces coryli]
MDLTITRAQPADYDAVADLVGAVYLDDDLLTFGEQDSYLNSLRDVATRAAQAEVLIARTQDTGELLGSVTYAAPGSPYAELGADGTAEFRMLAVARAGRGRGVGEALVRACLDRARQQGATRVALSTLDIMTTAHRLYERLGFRRTPERDWNPRTDIDLKLLTYELTL